MTKKHSNTPLLLSSAFAALSLVFVFSTGGFSERPELRAKVASLQNEVSEIRGSLGAQLRPVGTVTQFGRVCLPTERTPWIQVTSPNGGQTWDRNNDYTVTWNYCKTPANGKSKISIINQSTGVVTPMYTPCTTADVSQCYPLSLKQAVIGSSADWGGLSSLPNGSYKIKVECQDGLTGGVCSTANNYSDQSDTAFTLSGTIQSSSILTTLVLTDTSASPGPNANDDIGTFRIKFKVTAVDDDVYIPKNVSQALTYLFQKSGTSTISPSGTAFAFTAVSGADSTGNNNYEIDEGDTATFQLTGVVILPAAGSAGLYRMILDGINWSDSDTGVLHYYKIPSPFMTPYLFLN